MPDGGARMPRRSCARPVRGFMICICTAGVDLASRKHVGCRARRHDARSPGERGGRLRHRRPRLRLCGRRYRPRSAGLCIHRRLPPTTEANRCRRRPRGSPVSAAPTTSSPSSGKRPLSAPTDRIGVVASRSGCSNVFPGRRRSIRRRRRVRDVPRRRCRSLGSRRPQLPCRQQAGTGSDRHRTRSPSRSRRVHGTDGCERR